MRLLLTTAPPVRAALLSALALGLSVSAPSVLRAQENWLPVAAGYPRTAAELNGFTASTRHLEMWDYLEQLRAVAPDMRLGTYGETREGRKLAYAVFSRPLVSEPWEAAVLGRPVLVLAANVHGGERTFREGLLILMRDFATPGTEAYELLDEVTIVVAPQINPDGFEASQNGQRGNSWGIDLNRDYIKLEHPSIANYIANVIGRWRPHLFIDGHNGGSRPYNLNYQCTSLYNSDPELTSICDDEIFPLIDARLATEGMRAWYYQFGNEQEWTTGGFQARIGRNYGGLINSVGILFEAPQQSMERGARAGYLGYLTTVKYAAEHAKRLMSLVERTKTETLAMGAGPTGQFAVTMEYAPRDEPASYTLVRGGQDGTPVDTIEVTGARLMKKPVATKFRDRPWAYVLPRNAEAAAAMLLRHGITVEQLTAPATIDVQVYTVAGVTHEPQYNHAAATMVEVGEVLTQEMTLPKDTYVVPTSQFLGRLVSHMLEVETDDNVVYWNTMDAWLPRPGMMGQQAQGPPLVPIYKIMRPTPLESKIVEAGN